MDALNRVAIGTLVTVGRLAHAVVPTYLVAVRRVPEVDCQEGAWEWAGADAVRPRVWLTLAAADVWARDVTGLTGLGPTAVLHTDCVPPPPGVEPAEYRVPHCRVVRLYELGDHGQVVPAETQPDLDQLCRLIHELYHPMPDDRREEVPSVDPAPQG